MNVSIPSRHKYVEDRLRLVIEGLGPLLVYPGVLGRVKTMV